MASTITTSVEALDDHKVKVHVAVTEAEFDKAITAAFRKLAQEVKIDGFRQGKAPRKLLEARLGTEIARDQALRDALPDYYAQAVREHDLDTIAAPEIDITSGEESGPVEFDAVVAVRPEVAIEGYRGLRVELDVPGADDEAIDAQVEALRQRFADLEDSDQPLTDGDYAEIDVTGTIGDDEVAGLSATDYLYEVGSGLVVPELDVELRGTRPGAILAFDAELPDTAAEHAGAIATFRVLVKETKKKVLPTVDDEWVAEVSEFDTVADLRADLARRVRMMTVLQAQMAMREKVLDAVADLVTIEIPEPLVASELEHRVRDLAERLGAQGATIDQYLEATGRDREQFIEELRAAAIRAARADLALRAVVAQEAIEVADDDLDAEIERLAQRYEEKPAKLRKELDRRGVLEAVRSDLARGKALQLLVEEAEPVDTDGTPVDLSLPELEASGPETPEEAPELEADPQADEDLPADEESK